MKGKQNLAFLCVVIIFASLVFYKTYQSQNVSVSVLRNLVALTGNEADETVVGSTSGESDPHRYPHLLGKPKKCKLYVYMKGGVVVGTSATKNNSFEGGLEYERYEASGLEDTCPINKEGGCNPYSCQQVAY